MANSQDKYSLGNGPGKNPQDGSLGNGPEKNPQDGSQSQRDDAQKHDSITVFDPPRGQDFKSNFEHCFNNAYSFQTSMLSNLTRLDFKNLQLAGIRISVSREIQQKYLLPSKCNEKLRTPGSESVTCTNTTETVREIKACHGKHRQYKNLALRPGLVKHVRGSKYPVEESDEHEGGSFGSFNVCIQCRDRDRERRLAIESQTIRACRAILCRHHSLKYLHQRPYNMCRCRMFLDQHWRCHACSLDTLAVLGESAGYQFWELHPPDCSRKDFDSQEEGFDEWKEDFPGWEEKVEDLEELEHVVLNLIAQGNAVAPEDQVCIITGCKEGGPWDSGPQDQQMLLCGGCDTIIPALGEDMPEREISEED